MKKLLFVVAFVLAIGQAEASRVTELDAQQAVEAWLSRSPVAQATMNGITQVASLVPYDADANLYLAKLSPSGYVVIAGSDVVSPVIAFSVDDFIEEDTTSPLVEKLIAVAEMVAVAEAAGGESHVDWAALFASSTAAGSKARSVSLPSTYANYVEPFLTTAWSQDQPFNDFAPIHNPTEEGSNRGHTACGCVATAMSQIFAYWQWPARMDAVNQCTHGFSMDSGASYGDYVIRFDGRTPFDYTGVRDKVLSYQGNYNYDLRGSLEERKRFAIARLVMLAGSLGQMKYANHNSLSLFEYVIQHTQTQKWFDKGSILTLSSSRNESTANAIYESLSQGIPVPVSTDTHAIVACGWASSGSQDYAYFNYGYGYNPYNPESVNFNGWFALWGSAREETYTKAFVGFTPKKIVQIEPLPLKVTGSVTLNWAVPEKYAGGAIPTGFEIKQGSTVLATADAEDRTYTTEALTDGSYTFSITPIFGEIRGTATTVSTTVAASAKDAPVFVTLRGSDATPIVQQCYKECALGNNVIWVECNAATTELQAYPSHLTEVADDDITVHNLGSGNFAVEVDGTDVTGRTRCILTLEATNEDESTAYKDVVLRFSDEKTAEIYNSANKPSGTTGTSDVNTPPSSGGGDGSGETTTPPSEDVVFKWDVKYPYGTYIPDGSWFAGTYQEWDSGCDVGTPQWVIDEDGLATQKYVVYYNKSSDCWVPYEALTSQNEYTLAIYGCADMVQPPEGKYSILWSMGSKLDYHCILVALVKDSAGNIQFLQFDSQNQITQSISVGAVKGYHLFTVRFSTLTGASLQVDDGEILLNPNIKTATSIGLTIGGAQGVDMEGSTPFVRGTGFVVCNMFAFETSNPTADRYAALCNQCPAIETVSGDVSYEGEETLYLPSLTLGNLSVSQATVEVVAGVAATAETLTLGASAMLTVNGSLAVTALNATDGATVTVADGATFTVNGAPYEPPVDTSEVAFTWTPFTNTEPTGWFTAWDGNATVTKKSLLSTLHQPIDDLPTIDESYHPYKSDFSAKDSFTVAVYGCADRVKPTGSNLAVLWSMGTNEGNKIALVKDALGDIKLIQATGATINKTVNVGAVNGYHLFIVRFDTTNGVSVQIDNGSDVVVLDDSFTTVADNGFCVGSVVNGLPGGFEMGTDFSFYTMVGLDTSATPHEKFNTSTKWYTPKTTIDEEVHYTLAGAIYLPSLTFTMGNALKLDQAQLEVSAGVTALLDTLTLGATAVVNVNGGTLTINALADCVSGATLNVINGGTLIINGTLPEGGGGVTVNVDDGCVCTVNGQPYPEPEPSGVAKIGDAFYGSLDDAIIAATAGQKIVVIADTTLSSIITESSYNSKGITLEVDENVTLTVGNYTKEACSTKLIVKGTLALGKNRWVFGVNNAITLYTGGTISGEYDEDVSDAKVGTLDLHNLDAVTVIQNGEELTATITAPFRIRRNVMLDIPVDVTLEVGDIPWDKHIGGAANYKEYTLSLKNGFIKVTGEKSPYRQIVSGKENYLVRSESVTGGTLYALELATVKIGSALYDSLSGAVGAVPDNTSTTIEILKSSSEAITIPAKKKVTLRVATAGISLSGTITVAAGAELTLEAGDVYSANAPWAAKVTNNGILHTKGNMTLSSFATRSALIVETGVLTVQGNAEVMYGDITIESPAILKAGSNWMCKITNAQYPRFAIKGQLDMGSVLWTIHGDTSFKMYAGSQITAGTGGTLQFNGGTITVLSNGEDKSPVSYGATLKLAGNTTIDVAEDLSLTVSGVISQDGVRKLSFTGAGVATLSGANTYSGGTDIGTEVTVEVANLSALGSSGTITGGGKLKITTEMTTDLANGFNGKLTDTWTGTVLLTTLADQVDLQYLGNSNSFIELTESKTGFFKRKVNCLATLVLSQDVTLTFSNGWSTYSANGVEVMRFHALAGNGIIATSKDIADVKQFTQGASAFTGSIKNTNDQCFVFGELSSDEYTVANSEDYKGTIQVLADATVNVATEWCAKNGMVVGGVIKGAGSIQATTSGKMALTLKDNATLDASTGALTVKGAVSIGAIKVKVPDDASATPQIFTKDSTDITITGNNSVTLIKNGREYFGYKAFVGKDGHVYLRRKGFMLIVK